MAGLKTTLQATCLALAALSAPALAPAAQAAGTLTVAQPQDPGSWDPIDTFLVYWGSVGSQIFDGLVQRGPDMKLVPGLATSWEFRDNDTRIRFKLRDGVKFHDGEPFNADAVKFTFDRLLGTEGAKGPQRSNYTAIDHVEIVDPLTVDFVMKQPDPVLLTKLAGYGALIVPPKYIQEKGDEAFNIAPVGTGPFKFVEYKPKISLSLEKFDGYWGGAPKLDKLVYRFIAEPATQLAELQAGRIDIATPIPVNLAQTIQDAKDLKLVSIPGPTVNALRFNTRDGITKDADVRKALILAVDRETIVKTIMLGQAKPIVSFQGELSFGYDPALKALPFDPAQAKALLAKAGVKPGATVQIDFRGPDATFREVAQAVAGYLQAVGLKVTLKPYDTNVLLNDIIPPGKTGEMYQNAWGGWTFDYDNTAYLMYHKGERWNPYGDDAKLDALLEEQRKTYDQAKREATLREVARYVADQALELPLYNLNTILGVNQRVKGFEAPADLRFKFTTVSVD